MDTGGNCVTEAARTRRDVKWVAGIWVRALGEWAAARTLSANANFEHPGAEAVSSRHAEARVGGVVFRAHEDVARRGKAERLDAFHLHVIHVRQMNRPGGRKRSSAPTPGIRVATHTPRGKQTIKFMAII